MKLTSKDHCVFAFCWAFLLRLRTGSWSDLHVRVRGFVRLFCLRAGVRAPEIGKNFRLLTKNTKKSLFFRYNFAFCMSNIIENIFSNITNNSCPDGEPMGEENEQHYGQQLPGRETEEHRERTHTGCPDGEPMGEENEQQGTGRET